MDQERFDKDVTVTITVTGFVGTYGPDEKTIMTHREIADKMLELLLWIAGEDNNTGGMIEGMKARV